MKTIKLLAAFIMLCSFMRQEKTYTMLCLGDSYTIGESVEEHERFPLQAVKLLQKDGINFEKPIIIAQTGWTTDELMTAIKEQKEQTAAALEQNGNEIFVTLLIGVNNQYRGRDSEEYRKEFIELLQTALQYANGKPNQVFVLSIPDWGVTPFVAKDPKHRTGEQIGKEIDMLNAISREEAQKANVHYIDITPVSREAKQKPELITKDGLHPSGKMYAAWAEVLAGKIKQVISGK